MKQKLPDSCCAHMFAGCENLRIIEKPNPDEEDKIVCDFRKGHDAETYNKKSCRRHV